MMRQTLQLQLFPLPYTLLRQRLGCGESRWPLGNPRVFCMILKRTHCKRTLLSFSETKTISDLTEKWTLYRKSHKAKQRCSFEFITEFIQELQKRLQL